MHGVTVPCLSLGGFAEFSRCFPGLCEGKSTLVPTCISQPCLPVANIGPTRILPNLYLGCQRDVLNKVGALNITFIAGFLDSGWRSAGLPAGCPFRHTHPVFLVQLPCEQPSGRTILPSAVCCDVLLAVGRLSRCQVCCSYRSKRPAVGHTQEGSCRLDDFTYRDVFIYCSN